MSSGVRRLAAPRRDDLATDTLPTAAPTSKGPVPPLHSRVFESSSPSAPILSSATMSWRAASAVHMERALLERCPNTLLRRRAAEALKSQVQPRITVSDLALAPQRAMRPIATSVSTPMPASIASMATPAALPCYTSLAEIIPTPGSPMVERVASPRTPMRNRLVEKAARAYLLPSDPFDKRSSESKPWTQSFSRFLPRLSVFTMALNPFNAFSSAFNVFRFYLTGSRALQPHLANSVTRSMSRSVSMPVPRTSYTHDLSIR